MDNQEDKTINAKDTKAENGETVNLPVPGPVDNKTIAEKAANNSTAKLVEANNAATVEVTVGKMIIPIEDGSSQQSATLVETMDNQESTTSETEVTIAEKVADDSKQMVEMNDIEMGTPTQEEAAEQCATVSLGNQKATEIEKTAEKATVVQPAIVVKEEPIDTDMQSAEDFTRRSSDFPTVPRIRVKQENQKSFQEQVAAEQALESKAVVQINNSALSLLSQYISSDSESNITDSEEELPRKNAPAGRRDSISSDDDVQVIPNTDSYRLQDVPVIVSDTETTATGMDEHQNIAIENIRTSLVEPFLTGWSFEPEQVEIKFDGRTDICSQGRDVNFNFKGFGITGKVEIYGHNVGAKEVQVELLSESNTKIGQTFTDSNGIFSFTPIKSGKYVIKVKHDKWHFVNAEYAVTVTTGNTEIPAKSLVVFGFQVEGRVHSDEQPFGNVGFLLYPEKGAEALFKCSSSNIPAVPWMDPKFSGEPRCYTEANKATGTFTFAGVSSGKYRVVPHFNNKAIKFHIKPEAMEFELGRDSLRLPESYKVTRFSVGGRVLQTVDGPGVRNAKIKMNGKEVATTGSDGKYTLDNIQASTYTIQVTADDLQFKDHIAKISLSNPALPDVVVSGFKDEISADEDAPRVAPPIKSKGEVLPTELPPIEDLQISVPEAECKPIGHVESIVAQIVIVQSYAGVELLNLETVLFLEKGKRALGKIFDVIGQVTAPMYCVLFNNRQDVIRKGISVGMPVYCAPQTEHTSFIILSDLMRDKGSDASWLDDNEAPDHVLDYSDDEQERRARRRRGSCSSSGRNSPDGGHSSYQPYQVHQPYQPHQHHPRRGQGRGGGYRGRQGHSWHTNVPVQQQQPQPQIVINPFAFIAGVPPPPPPPPPAPPGSDNN